MSLVGLSVQLGHAVVVCALTLESPCLCVVLGCGCWLAAWRLSLNELGELHLCITSEPVGLEWWCLLLMSTMGPFGLKIKLLQDSSEPSFKPFVSL